MERNGIDTTALDVFVDAMHEIPDGGSVTVRTRHRWDDGFAVDGTAETLTQFGAPLERSHHRFRTDWPEPLARDSGPTPGAESVAAAVGACVTTTFVAAAARRGVTVEDLEAVVEASVDLNHLFDPELVGTGFQGIEVTLRVRADADADVLEQLGELTGRTSPAFGVIANPVAATLRVEHDGG